MPLPSERTLQRKIEGFKFAPGLLTEVMDLLKIKIGDLSQQERHAVLMLDEMQITKGLDFDPSTGMLLGRPTVPLANNSLPESCYATHALVFMLEAALELLKLCEAYFLGNAESILQSRISLIAIKKDIFENMVTNIPSCHNVPRKLVNVFLRSRMHIFLRNKNDVISKEDPQPKCGSRSIGMRDAAKGIR
ncbi:hypothetical protein HPB52_023495 [Rhipicephalus sanguineus]|uniref:Transposable element P transposase-like RNase H domain-containing protein n=1 Tax=Rhipicephalus sanguineus TaxID=34632 RepID=A0A9D4TC55_RHISA|nr:hypothetical protein HPB52_023495 [Rhipicephalus sanguineus]